MWIEFASSEMAEAFATIAAGEYDTKIESLYNRVVGGWEPRDDWETFRAERAWRYDVSVEDIKR